MADKDHNKTIHLALLKEPVNAKVLKHLKPTLVSKSYPPEQKFQPEETVKEEPAYRKVAQRAGEVRRKTMLRTKLRVLHESVPPPEETPPCDTCKTAPCCSAFVVPLTPEEYESGIYGDYAVKLLKKDFENIQGLEWALTVMTAGNIKKDAYLLEGRMGEPCPFLQEDNRCGIYEKRPVTCRAYSCVGDSRITQGMRDGTEPVKNFFDYKLNNVK